MLRCTALQKSSKGAQHCKNKQGRMTLEDLARRSRGFSRGRALQSSYSAAQHCTRQLQRASARCRALHCRGSAESTQHCMPQPGGAWACYCAQHCKVQEKAHRGAQHCMRQTGGAWACYGAQHCEVRVKAHRGTQHCIRQPKTHGHVAAHSTASFKAGHIAHQVLAKNPHGHDSGTPHCKFWAKSAQQGICQLKAHGHVLTHSSARVEAKAYHTLPKEYRHVVAHNMATSVEGAHY